MTWDGLLGCLTLHAALYGAYRPRARGRRAATLAAGPLFSAFYARAFWAMAVLSIAAVPLALRLRPPRESTTSA